MKIFKKLLIASFAFVMLCGGALFVGCSDSLPQGEGVPPTLEEIEDNEDKGDNENGDGELPPEPIVNFDLILEKVKDHIENNSLLFSDIDDALVINITNKVLTITIDIDANVADADYFIECFDEFTDDEFNVVVSQEINNMVLTISKI